MSEILEIKHLFVEYYKRRKIVSALRDVCLTLKKQEILGIVGESGCGKTTLALSVLKLILPVEGEITKGEIIFHGYEMWEEKYFKNKNIITMNNNSLREIRGGGIGMIFQDPFTSFNPVLTIGEQIYESLALHRAGKDLNTYSRIHEEAINSLKRAMIASPERVMNSYPHQLSGGMLQRAMIAMAISCRPKILIADEPTTALDVTLQKEILELLKKLQQELYMSLILITHNLAIVAEICTRIVVMYAGEIIEEASSEEIFCRALHPYTIGLLGALPSLKPEAGRLSIIPGSIPDLIDLPVGCKFYPRCNRSVDSCLEEIEMKEVSKGHFVRCCRVKEKVDVFY